MFNCIIDNDLTEKGCLGECDKFEECWDEIEKRNEEYRKIQDAIKKQTELIDEQLEKLDEKTQKALIKEFSDRLVEKMLEGILTDPPDPLEIAKTEEDIDDE